ncbi:Cro/CI family transcriptional regulator [Moraxella nasibovis]|uniref:Cro/CI family transcriptional regulator n=1 Tax=Moraxella nasibovis TaxID=2904120 RepID=UPI00240EC2EB|nr:Cro/CI family transcriptional regulator [Moraxella nasibovis]WFF38008.1 Cro/CI family transcriptional regulator [Moraxella nasibovis]
MTKQEALKVAKGSVNELGRLLGISHAAVSQWNDEKIPELRAYQVREIMARQQAQARP